MRMPVTAAQTVGPFFSIGLNGRLAPPPRPPQPLMTGCIRDGDGAPVRDAVLEVWTLANPHAVHFQRTATNDGGVFAWALGEDSTALLELTGCWTVLLFLRGLLRPLLTRVYLPSHLPPAHDLVWSRIPLARRATLIAQEIPSAVPAYRWDIHLQSTLDGSAETAFFDCASAE